jgi:hypothetical protein
MSSNPNLGTDMCVSFFCVSVVLHAGSGLASGWSPVQSVVAIVYNIKKLKNFDKVLRAVLP